MHRRKKPIPYGPLEAIKLLRLPQKYFTNFPNRIDGVKLVQQKWLKIRLIQYRPFAGSDQILVVVMQFGVVRQLPGS